MNNNRGNNRRRGRSSNRQQGGQQVNRIDSRARGNAPQLLEKYRKLAHDAHLNGDRVTEEYYLQFADHYFRVMADMRLRQEEQRPRRDDRWQEGADGERDYDAEDGGDSYDQPADASRSPREERSDGSNDEAAEGSDRRPSFQQPDNPFTRDARSRPLRPRRDDRRPRREEAADSGDPRERDDAPAGLDPASLPPSISAPRDVAGDEAADQAEAKPRRRTRKPRPASDGEGEPLQAVSPD